MELDPSLQLDIQARLDEMRVTDTPVNFYTAQDLVAERRVQPEVFASAAERDTQLLHGDAANKDSLNN